MYEYLSGTISELAPTHVVLDVGGVGYFIQISLQTYSEIEHSDRVKLFVHYVVREDAQLLYGFASKAERELFRHLISVSGVGGNTARMILSTYSPRELQGIIATENAVLLKNVKGLGLKTAQKIIAALEGESIKYETYFKLVLATGLRRGEACGLKWSDINWRKRTIHVQRGVVKLSHQESITKDPKTSSGDRMVYLSKEMCQLLKAWHKECEWDRQQTANETVSEDDYLFRQPNGKPMNPCTFTYRFKLILKANNLPLDLSVHSLRHTNASLLIAQGVDVRTVASLLGHAQASTTLDIYAHAFDKNKRKAQEKLGKAIGL